MLRAVLILGGGLACLPVLAKDAAPAKPAAASPMSSAFKAAAKSYTPTDPSSAPSKTTDTSSSRYPEPDSVDSVGALTLRPEPDPVEKLPSFFEHTQYLREHNDEGMAADYLQHVVVNDPKISTAQRARAILELADSLQRLHRQAETLCWLKIWMGLYSGRTETAAVAYRMGMIYSRMGLPSLARDSYYLALSYAINHGQVQNAADLKNYQRLTNGVLWALAQNEYQSGEWARGAQLFDRYIKEAPSASPELLEKAAYLQADCYYQLRQNDKATAAYDDALAKHPFYPLAPEARLRLYHLDMLAHKPVDAQQELQALVWTVRTVWPKQETYWQKRAAELLLALNRKNGATLPPLLARSAGLHAQDKAWQGELDHYDKLARFQAATMQTIRPQASASPAAAVADGLREQDDLVAMQRSIADLAPPRIALPAVASADNHP